MTLNVGSLFEPDWDDRRHEVVAWIQRVDPDIVCFQEATKSTDSDATAWIVEALGDGRHFVMSGHPFGAYGEADENFRFGSSIISRWPIDESNLWPLSTADDPDDPMPAAMPWELVHARTADLDIFTTHLAPAPSHGRHRRLQVLEIDQHIKDIRGTRDRLGAKGNRAAMPPILTGDFNAEPDSDEIRFLKGLTVLDDRTTFFQDAWAVAGDGSTGLTNDWHTHPLSARLNVHPKRIDYIFVGDPFLREGNGGRIIETQLVAHEPLTGVQASDHVGLIADIEWPDRP